MRKMWVVLTGLLCLVAQGARARGFERQVEERLAEIDEAIKKPNEAGEKSTIAIALDLPVPAAGFWPSDLADSMERADDEQRERVRAAAAAARHKARVLRAAFAYWPTANPGDSAYHAYRAVSLIEQRLDILVELLRPGIDRAEPLHRSNMLNNAVSWDAAVGTHLFTVWQAAEACSPDRNGKQRTLRLTSRSYHNSYGPPEEGEVHRQVLICDGWGPYYLSIGESLKVIPQRQLREQLGPLFGELKNSIRALYLSIPNRKWDQTSA